MKEIIHIGRDFPRDSSRLCGQDRSARDGFYVVAHPDEIAGRPGVEICDACFVLHRLTKPMLESAGYPGRRLLFEDEKDETTTARGCDGATDQAS